MKEVNAKVAAYVLSIIMIAGSVAFTPKTVNATLTGFPNLPYHGINDWASSLKVQGTVILYEHVDYQGDSISFTDGEIWNLDVFGWNDRASSLKVDGTVTLYEYVSYSGNTCAFTSGPDPNENLGAQWSSNPNLLLSQGKWDSRKWHWDLYSTELEGGDANNYVTWYDGYVDSRSQDYGGDHWSVSNFDQGWHQWEAKVPNLASLGWDNCISSLRVRGTVTLYDNINYGGAWITFGPYQGKDGWISNLTYCGWNDRASSLQVQGVVTVYDSINYVYYPLVPGCALHTFNTAAYQPPMPIYLDTADSVTLEGVAYDWSHTGGLSDSSWDGAKFDVWACYDLAGGPWIMLELYFLRGGANLLWPSNPFLRPTLPYETHFSYMCAIDGLFQRAWRTVHPGDVVRWKVDVLSLLEQGAGACGLDMDLLKIFQISFTVEAGTNVLWQEPYCRCKCKKLRICYTLGGGGGCPILSAFDGSQYVDEGLLNIHNANGEDVVTAHTLTTMLQPVNNRYLLRLMEHPKTHSYIDQVKLFAILEDYREVRCPLIWANHSEYGNVLPKLVFSDEWKTETIGADLNDGTSQYIDLRFLALPKNLKLLGFRFYIEGNNPVMK